MIFRDAYKTIKSPARGLFRDKGSRFIAFADPVSSTEQIKALLDGYRKQYHDARHHCFAYILGHDKSVWRINDDGEPSGTAGKPIMGQINSNDLTNIIIVVVRYFGGTLLGVSGLINAYKSAANDAIMNSEIIESTVKDFYRLKFPYSSMNDVMRLIKDENIIHSEQVFELDCTMKIGFRVSSGEHILSRFQTINNLSMEFLERL